MTTRTTPDVAAKYGAPRAVFLVVVLLVGLAAAVAYHSLRVPPSAQSSATIEPGNVESKRVVQIPIELLETPDEYLEVDVAALNTLHSLNDIAQKRNALVTYLWGTSTLPDSVPIQNSEGFSDDRYAKMSAVASIDRLVVQMDFGLESVVYHFHPKTSNGDAVIFHQGHRGDFFHSKQHIEAFLERGYAVIALSMPLLGLNNQPVVQLPRFGRLKLIDHDNMKFLTPSSGHPLQYFVEPVVAVVNYLENEYKTVSMVGISGGGWTATIVAAIDTRIGKSFPVAGSYPMYLRSNSRRDWGDYEQTEPGFYRLATYLELYTMGAVGPGRSQLQILNQLDACCFGGTKWETYAPSVAERVAALGAGNYRLFMDDTHMEHQISDVAMEQIFRELGAR